MNAGHFRQNLESSGDLNRRSQDGVVSLKHGRLAHVRSQFSLFRRSPTHKNLPPATFCTSEHVLFGYFLHNAKSDNPFSLQRTSRFCKPRISAPKLQLRTSPLKSFCRYAAFPPPLAALFFVADATNLCASRYYRRLFRLCNFPTESLSLPRQHTCMLRSSPQSRRAPYTNLKTSPREYQPF